MTLKLSERELEQLLRDPGRDLRPPEGLLARLRADLPAELPAEEPTEPPTGQPSEPPHGAAVLRPAVWWRRPVWSLAASLAILLGGSLIAYRNFREAAPLGAASEARPAHEKSPAPAAKPQATAATAPELMKEAAPALPSTLPSIPEQRLGRLAPADAVAEKLEILPDEEVGSFAETTEGSAGGGRADLDGLTTTAPLPAGPPLPIQAAAAPPAASPPADEALAARDDSSVSGPPPDPTGRETIRFRLETPGVESNSQIRSEAPFELDSTDKRLAARQLEIPTTQGDAGRHEPAPSLAAVGGAETAPGGKAKLESTAALLELWRPIEQALASGRWPTAEERAAFPLQPLAEGKKGLLTDAKDDAATYRRGTQENERAEPADPVMKLFADTLDFFANRDQQRPQLLELRRRALQLLQQQPQDERLITLLRSLNLAQRLLPG